MSKRRDGSKGKDIKRITALGCLWKSRYLSIIDKVGILNGMLASTVLFSSETLVLKTRERRLEVLNLGCFRRVVVVNVNDKIRNRD